jgi:hypothetical protein
MLTVGLHPGEGTMAVRLDAETIARFRTMSPEDVFRQVTDAVYAAGGAGSEDFLDVYEQLVEEGILRLDQVRPFDRGARR